MKVLFLVAACALAASAEELTWNAQSIAIGGSDLWRSDDGGEEKNTHCLFHGVVAGNPGFIA